MDEAAIRMDVDAIRFKCNDQDGRRYGGKVMDVNQSSPDFFIKKADKERQREAEKMFL